MKIIHTFYPIEDNLTYDMEKILLYSKKSVNSVLNFYDEVILYTTKEFQKLVIGYGIPYTEINTELFTEYDVKITNYSIPKLIVYSSQTEPYIHIDFDVLMFRKIENDNDIFFGYMDYDFNNETDDQLSEFMTSYYVDDYKLISKKLPFNQEKETKFGKVPNFCFFGVNDFKTVSLTCKNLIRFYNDNISDFNLTKHGPSQIEQFLFSIFLKRVNEMTKWENTIEETNPFMCDDEKIYLKNNDSYTYVDESDEIIKNYLTHLKNNNDFTFIHVNNLKTNVKLENLFFSVF